MIPTRQQLEEQYGDKDILGSSLEERKSFIGEVIEKAGDNIANAILGNPLARTSDVTSFVETPMGATGFTDDNKKVSNLTDAELNFLRERNEEKLRAETGFGMPIVSGSRDDEAQFKLFDPKQAFLTGDGSTEEFGNRAAQNMLMQQTIDGTPIGELLAKQKQVLARAPSLESIARAARVPSIEEQRASFIASQELQDRIKNKSNEQSSGKSDLLGPYMELARQQGAKGGAVKLAAQQLKAADEREAAKFEQQSRQSGALSQLSPTQLTYLMGQLGYEITPKKSSSKEENNLTEIPTLESSEGQAILNKVKKANRNVSEAALIAELRAKNKIA